jgi:arylsulfatase A-like enzyme
MEKNYPRQPVMADSTAQVKRMFDGYDTGIRYADEHVGKILTALSDLDVLDETAILVSADHGEMLGELNVYGDHQAADQQTCRVPCILKWPGMKPRVDTGLHYQIDVTAGILELLGGKVPENWDGQSFADSSRPYLVLSQAAWACQRAVRFDNYICIKSYHDAHHDWPQVMLFDLANDPHEQHDLSQQRPELVITALAKLDEWRDEMKVDFDPMQTVLNEGGGFYTRGHLQKYLDRLRKTGRAQAVEKPDSIGASDCTGR